MKAPCRYGRDNTVHSNHLDSSFAVLALDTTFTKYLFLSLKNKLIFSTIYVLLRMFSIDNDTSELN